MRELAKCDVEWIDEIPTYWKVIRNKYIFDLK